jgi:hypothetical protein
MMAHELTDWYEEAERLRVERDALTARLAERDAEIAALREAAQWFVGANTPPNGTCLYCPGHAAHEPWCPVAKVLAVVAAVPAPPTPAADKERETPGLTHVVGAHENNTALQALIDARVAFSLSFPPGERRRLIEPWIAFLSGVNELSDDQVVHLQVLREYHATLTAAAPPTAAAMPDLEAFTCPTCKGSGRVRHIRTGDEYATYNDYVPVPPTTAPLAAAERAVIQKAGALRELVVQPKGILAWLPIGIKQRIALGEFCDAMDALRAARGEAGDMSAREE